MGFRLNHLLISAIMVTENNLLFFTSLKKGKSMVSVNMLDLLLERYRETLLLFIYLLDFINQT